MRNKYWLFLFMLFMITVAFFIGKSTRDRTVLDAKLIQEKVEEVLSLETTIIHMNEIFTYHPKSTYDLFGLGKKVILKVDAKVHLGFRLDSLDITVDDQKREIVIVSNYPFDILSLEHDVEYYDIKNSIFNPLTEKDFTMIQTKAKEIIRDEVLTSGIMDDNRIKAIQRMKSMGKAVGYDVRFVREEMKK